MVYNQGLDRIQGCKINRELLIFDTYFFEISNSFNIFVSF